MSRAPRAIRVAFLTAGIGVGTLYSRVADIKETLQISNAQVGSALFVSAIGVLVAIQLGGRLCASYGSKRVSVYGSFLASGSIAFFGFSDSYKMLLITLFFFGFLNAIQDIGMNTHASTLEHETNKRYMSGFHAVFSVGALIGGAVGGLASQFEITLKAHAVAMGIALFILNFSARNWWMPSEIDIHEFKKEGKAPKSFIFIFIGLLGLISTINEGAAGDWGGILARETFNANGFLSVLPYIAFNLSMVIGRFSGDRLATKFGAMKILFSAGLIAGIGLSGGLIIGTIYGQILGWLAIGAGMSVVIPMVFSLAGEIARTRNGIAPSQAVAIASGISYLGFMGGPPIMGYLSSALTLRWAMLIPAALSIFLAFGSQRVKHS